MPLRSSSCLILYLPPALVLPWKFYSDSVHGCHYCEQINTTFTHTRRVNECMTRQTQSPRLQGGHIWCGFNGRWSAVGQANHLRARGTGNVGQLTGIFDDKLSSTPGLISISKMSYVSRHRRNCVEKEKQRERDNFRSRHPLLYDNKF